MKVIKPEVIDNFQIESRRLSGINQGHASKAEESRKNGAFFEVVGAQWKYLSRSPRRLLLAITFIRKRIS